MIQYFKIYHVLAFCALCIMNGKSQGIALLQEKYLINYVEIDSMDYSSTYVKNEAYIKFYSVSNQKDSFYMANIWPKGDSQSFGLVTNFTSYNSINEDDNLLIYAFTWHYHNTYDGKSGKAKVSFVKVLSQDRRYFEFYIEPEGQKSVIYSGPIVPYDSKP